MRDGSMDGAACQSTSKRAVIHLVQCHREYLALSSSKALNVSLYLSGWLLLSVITAAADPQALSGNKTEIAKHLHSLEPLAQLPVLGAFCAFQYPGSIRQCQVVMTHFILFEILDWNYLSPHSGRLWHDAIFWASFLIMAKAHNPVFDRRRFPDFGDTLYLATLIRCFEIGADTGIRMLGYWPQKVDENHYVLLKDIMNSIATGLVTGSVLFLQPSVTIAYKLSVPFITSILVMTCSNIFSGRGAYVFLMSGAVAGAGAGTIVGTIVGAIAGVGIVVRDMAIAGTVALVGAVAGAIAGAVAVAEAVTVTVALSEPEFIFMLEVVAATVTVTVPILVVHVLFYSAIRKVALYDFGIMANYLPYELARSGVLFIITGITALTAQVLSGTNSGLTLSDSWTMAVKKLWYGWYSHLGASIACGMGLWMVLRASQPQRGQ